MGNFKVLIVSATEFEIKPLINNFTFDSSEKKNIAEFQYNNLKIDILVAGIGICSTTFLLTKTLLENKYDLIINTGICGSFRDDVPIGSVVNVIKDEFADLGITDKNNFHTLFDENLIEKNQFPYKNGTLANNFNNNYLSKFRKVNGITVNSASGNRYQIEMRKNKYKADIESMEGAAFFYVCLNENLPFIQIRSISNFVEERNKKAWNIPLAVENLNIELTNLLNNLSSNI